MIPEPFENRPAPVESPHPAAAPLADVIADLEAGIKRLQTAHALQGLRRLLERDGAIAHHKRDAGGQP